MDIRQLLTIGKIQKVVELTLPAGKMTIHLETPPIDQLQVDIGPYATVAQYVTKIDDQEFSTPESKKELAEVFSKLQVAAFSKLVDACNAINKEQEATTQEIFSGKA